MGVVPPEPGYLEGLREMTRRHGAVLVFDEVITGFRLGLGGAQSHFGVTPDLSCFGKVIGGGLPVGAFGGRAEIMDHLAPLGPVYQAGTLSGNPLAVSAGLAVLGLLEKDGVYDRLEHLGAELEQGLVRAAARANQTVCVNRVGSMMTLFFGPGPIRSFGDAAACDTEQFARFHRSMLERGVYLAPSAFEATFVSLAHSDEHIEQAVTKAEASLRAIS
jgi:glutamate-1-semialdehyde 2,1-aminomutase